MLLVSLGGCRCSCVSRLGGPKQRLFSHDLSRLRRFLARLSTLTTPRMPPRSTVRMEVSASRDRGCQSCGPRWLVTVPADDSFIHEEGAKTTKNSQLFIQRGAVARREIPGWCFAEWNSRIAGDRRLGRADARSRRRASRYSSRAASSAQNRGRHGGMALQAASCRGRVFPGGESPVGTSMSVAHQWHRQTVSGVSLWSSVRSSLRHAGYHGDQLTILKCAVAELVAFS